MVEDGKATGVRLAGGETVAATRAVIANVTPTQLYDGCSGTATCPPSWPRRRRRFRYGRGEMQIHLALSEPPRWEGDERLGGTAIVHVTPGLDGVSRAVNEADRGLLPAEATIVVGQPLTMDPSRAPEGAGLLWIQLQELPRACAVTRPASSTRATARGRRSCASATRTASSARLARQIPNLEAAIKARTVLSPADLEQANINLAHGDPYGGSLALDQNFLWRPFPASPGHATAVDRLWHIGASTHPGPGLGAGSGTLVAQQLLRPAAAEAGRQPAPRPRLAVMPRFAISQITTLPASFEDDLRAYRDAGAEGIGIWEIKLREGEEEALLAALRESGLTSTTAVPGGAVDRADPDSGGPDDPAERVEAYCAGLRRLAPFEPSAVVLLTGPRRRARSSSTGCARSPPRRARSV